MLLNSAPLTRGRLRYMQNVDLYDEKLVKYDIYESPPKPRRRGRKPTAYFEDLPYICVICGRGYYHKRNLYRHSKYECTDSGQFKCTICDKPFTQNKTLKDHMQRKHGLILPSKRESV